MTVRQIIAVYCSKRRYVVLIAVCSIFLCFQNIGQAQQPAASPTPAVCPKIEYISGAGIRQRAEPKEDSRVLAVLTFNTEICVHRIEKEWAEISVKGDVARGWIPSKFVSSTYSDSDTLITEFFKARSDRDYGRAITLGERLLEAGDSRKAEREVELLLRVEYLYTKLGNLKKAAEFKARRAKAESESKWSQPPGESVNGVFQTWFYSKFVNSSQYEDGYDRSKYSGADVEIILDELELAKSDDTGILDTNHWQSRMHGLLPKIYLEAFDKNADEKFLALRKRLENKDLIIEAIQEEFRGGSVRPKSKLVEILPRTLVNEEDVMNTLMNLCKDGEAVVAWEIFSPETVKLHPFNFLKCIAIDEVEPALKKHRFLNSRYHIDFAIEAKISPPKLGILFSNLPPDIRGDLEVINRLIPLNVDLFRSLAPNLQKEKKIREYSTRVSTCENLVLPNPQDRELFLMAAGRFTEDCVQKISPVLRKDLSFARSILAKSKNAISAFDEAIQRDHAVLKLVLAGAHSQSDCPFSKFPADYPIALKRQVVAASRMCLEHLTEADFLDRVVFKELVSETIEMNILRRLPDSFRSDINILLRLPHEFRDPGERDLLIAFAGRQVLLDLAKNRGLAVLSEVRAKRSYDHPNFEDYNDWSPAEIADSSFWSELIEVSMNKKETCDGWKSIIDSWALNVKWVNSYELEEIISKFPLSEINEKFKCNFTKKDES